MNLMDKELHQPLVCKFTLFLAEADNQEPHPLIFSAQNENVNYAAKDTDDLNNDHEKMRTMHPRGHSEQYSKDLLPVHCHEDLRALTKSKCRMADRDGAG